MAHGLGTGLGLIISAELAAPDKFCVNVMSDAAFDMTASISRRPCAAASRSLPSC